ncbi:hypothetical protein BCA37_07250 [Mycobacterium sp. djl-10]|nr:hypothetical protein BCA37_07250 [Mycobacterium sp. djl-10]
MSTIATKLNSVTTKVKVGTAAVALVGAATLTPAIADATPVNFSIAQSVSAADLSTLPVLPGGLNATVDAGASAVGPASGGIVFLASLPLFAVEALRDTSYTIGNILGGEDSFIGGFFIGFGNNLEDALESGPFVPYGS